MPLWFTFTIPDNLREALIAACVMCIAAAGQLAVTQMRAMMKRIEEKLDDQRRELEENTALTATNAELSHLNAQLIRQGKVEIHAAKALITTPLQEVPPSTSQSETPTTP
jgi:hypothetical protein